jgi:hypothetical protein
MADESDIAGTTKALEGLQTQLKAAQQLADSLLQRAQKATGANADGLNKVSEIYQAQAKQLASIIELEEDLSKTIKDRQKLEADLADAQKASNKDQENAIKRQLDLKKEEAKRLKDAQDAAYKQAEAQKKLVKEIEASGNLAGKIFSDQRTKLIGFLASTERAYAAMRSLSRSMRDVADISVQSGSFLGMSGDFVKDFETTSAAALRYSFNLSQAQVKMNLLGITSEETAASFKEFSRIAPFEGQAKRLEELTTAAGSLSKILGVSLADATEYIIQSQLKFGRTAAQSAQTLLYVQQTTERVNRTFGSTVIQGRDVAKVLFDIGRESEGAAQDQEMLAEMLTKNLVQLQSQGYNYQQALKGAQTYLKLMTSEAPDWARILGGRELFQQLQGLDFGSALSQRLEQARPGLTREIQRIMTSGYDSYTKQRLVQQMLEGTSVGLEAMNGQLMKLLRQRGITPGQNDAQALQIIQALYHLNPNDINGARQIYEQAKATEELTKKRQDLLDLSKTATDVTQEGSKAQLQALETLRKEYGLRAGTEKEWAAAYLNNADLAEKKVQELAEAEATRNLEKQKQATREAHDAEVANLQKQIDAAKTPELKASLQSQLDQLQDNFQKTSGEAFGKQEGAGAAAVAADPVTEGLKLINNSLVSTALGLPAIVSGLRQLYALTGAANPTALATVAATAAVASLAHGALRGIQQSAENRSFEAGEIALNAKYAESLNRAQSRGDTTAIARIQKLMDEEKKKSSLSDVKSAWGAATEGAVGIWTGDTGTNPWESIQPTPVQFTPAATRNPLPGSSPTPTSAPPAGRGAGGGAPAVSQNGRVITDSQGNQHLEQTITTRTPLSPAQNEANRITNQYSTH